MTMPSFLEAVNISGHMVKGIKFEDGIKVPNQLILRWGDMPRLFR